ncbi:IS256 family transposase [Alkalihalobacillus sp. LMS39]|uniref:IS256 family transposase n=1 Tax=Alkalihalobacillus sp. LMS39 TaxID=2924032 RepID=UPI001FB35900|nr:IS256 family transposase [Alkalihalobacillus sp. LMS39]UOE92053.1 IS256 family transposase [Alkalihalobacillus sp. LMS39]UOE93543.1 IS256 family transposase [Alkalihalobacillus sp. LMS39]UOE95645.1 IS256 family transposase [Alkalihalobacillus sp. LMS39]UOE95808.1 IS256 family transposase [Alkalihalobacillus sp. LMS39]UOE95824.1 IS256 family transposase [Alkalihalobacillus sp. LMS39]
MVQSINENPFADQLDNMVREFVKQKLELIMKEEMQQYFEVEHPELKNQKNGHYERSLDTKYGHITSLKVPRDRENHFQTKVFKPYQRYEQWLGESIIQMYQDGMSTREIGKFVENVLGDTYSPTTISNITDVLIEDVEAWQSRQLEKRYSVLFLDGTYINLRRDDVENEVVYIILGINENGVREILGFHVGGQESSTGWEQQLQKLRERGVEEVLLGVFDGLSGLEAAFKRVFPKADVQRCIVHKVRNSLSAVRKKDREEIAEDLKAIYNSKNKEMAHEEFKNFSTKWSKRYPKVIKSWKEDLPVLLTFYKYPTILHRKIYCTNMIERFMGEIKRRTRKIVTFPNERAVEKVIYLRCISFNENKQKVAHGFGQQREVLQKMFEERYGTAEN